MRAADGCSVGRRVVGDVVRAAADGVADGTAVALHWLDTPPVCVPGGQQTAAVTGTTASCVTAPLLSVTLAATVVGSALGHV